jgi:hypothetical protein
MLFNDIIRIKEKHLTRIKIKPQLFLPTNFQIVPIFNVNTSK